MLRLFGLFLLLSARGLLIAAGEGRPAPLPAAAQGSARPQGGMITATGTPFVATSTPTPGCSPVWTSVPAPSIGLNATLYAVTELGPGDAWAVGSYTPQGDTRAHTLTLHWDGFTWTQIASPNLGSGNNTLAGVSGVATNDVWAVGSYTATYAQSLILHWDGSQWSSMTDPSPPALVKSLSGVAARAANDVWAVGDSFNTGSPSLPLILHWNGSAWAQVAAPAQAQNGFLSAVSVRSANDAWAVGSISGSSQGTTLTLTLHWDGSAWTLVPSPNGPYMVSQLFGVTALAGNDVWAVGLMETSLNAQWTLTLHWDGNVWALVPSPNPVGNYNLLYSVAGAAANDVWAVGTASGQALRLHWDGATWTDELYAAPYSSFHGVVARGTAAAWAVGQLNSQSWTQRLTDPCVTPSPTPIITPSSTTTPTPTRTGTPPTATATILPACRPTWQAIPAPPGPYRGISADSSNDAWIGGDGQVLHWNGNAWAAQPLPTAVGSVFLHPDSASAPTNVWGMNGQGAVQWDGSAWTVRTYPTPVPTWYNPVVGFSAVAAAAPNDVWLVGSMSGYISEVGPYAAAHWNGAAWSLDYSPIYGLAAGGEKPAGAYQHTAYLSAASMSGPGDLWAIGYDNWYGSSNPSGPFVVHGCCPRPEVPIQFGANDHFTAISALAPDNVWVVGGGPAGPIAMHWDGNTWTQVAVPSVGGLTAVVTVSATEAWAASASTLLHWDGTAWTVVPGGPVPLTLAASSPNDVWALTTSGLYHWPDLARFTDVPGDNPFYPYVQALVCYGYLSGYPCGGPGEPCDSGQRPYYRPNTALTRGQYSKIAGNAAGFTEPIPSDQQTFADVPPGSTFHDYIERLAIRGIIGGYPCGGVGEPCLPPQNRPYFRPNTTTTRGQIAKITALAAGWSDPIPSDRQTFEEVLPGSTFWLPIERLAQHGVIGGYPCGGPFEPCQPPLNRHYFRPNNTTTRGQTAKIVTLTFGLTGR